MTDPTVVHSTSGTSAVASTVVTFGFTAGAGNLLILIAACDDYKTGDPSGWTLLSPGGAQETFLGHYMWWKKAAGTENGVTYVIGSASKSTYHVLEFNNISATTQLDTGNGTFLQSFGTTMTTPAITPTTGRRLEVATIGSTGGSVTDISGWTNSYVELLDTQTASPIIEMATAWLVLTGDSTTTTSTTGTYNGTGPSARTAIIASFDVAPGGGSFTGTTAGVTTAASTVTGVVARSTSTSGATTASATTTALTARATTTAGATTVASAVSGSVVSGVTGGVAGSVATASVIAAVVATATTAVGVTTASSTATAVVTAATTTAGSTTVGGTVSGMVTAGAVGTVVGSTAASSATTVRLGTMVGVASTTTASGVLTARADTSSTVVGATTVSAVATARLGQFSGAMGTVLALGTVTAQVHSATDAQTGYATAGIGTGPYVGAGQLDLGPYVGAGLGG